MLHTSLPTLLHYEDRNSMAFSLEARVPLLDHRIVEFAFSLGGGDKIRGSWTKWPLRMAAARVLPAEVAWRRSKMGYPTPMARWLRRAPDREAARDLLFSRALAGRELIRDDVLKSAWERHQAGADYSRLLYRLLSVELWFRQTVDAWQPNPAVVPARRPAAAPDERAA